MPISISGSGTITGISAGGLPDGCITTDDIATNAVTAPKIGTTEQSRMCRAWVNFDGTGTVAIRASYNVSSITDVGVGIYTVNFIAPMPDANYALVVGGNALSNGSTYTFPIGRLNGTYTANAVDVVQTATGGGGSNADPTIMTVAIFR